MSSEGVSFIIPQVIAPDTSHWANWIDAALSSDDTHRLAANKFQERLLQAGRIPLLSWHHLEELLCVADENSARRRVAFLQRLPAVAFLRLPSDDPNIGSVIDIFSAEVSAVLSGANDLVSVRATAKQAMLSMGNGVDALGHEGWIWEVVRKQFLERREQAKLIVSTTGMNLFDENQTIGQIAQGRLRTAPERAAKISQMRSGVMQHIRTRGDHQIVDHESMSRTFMADVESFDPPTNMSARDVVALALVSQGVGLDEITDDALLSDLNQLALFRAKLKVVAQNLEIPFESVKHVRMELLPSWQVERALRQFGQDRLRRSGSDLVDGYLAALAPYVDELFVDKRTAEDFRRVKAKDAIVASLLCIIRKSANFEELAVSQ
jgi:hypothetical protein